MLNFFKEASLYKRLGQVDIEALVDRSVARIVETEGIRGGSLMITHGLNTMYVDLTKVDSSLDSDVDTVGIDKWTYPKGGGYPISVEQNGEISQWSFPLTVEGGSSVCINGCDSYTNGCLTILDELQWLELSGDGEVSDSKQRAGMMAGSAEQSALL